MILLKLTFLRTCETRIDAAGTNVGFILGVLEGAKLGRNEGLILGLEVGLIEGVYVGSLLGW